MTLLVWLCVVYLLALAVVIVHALWQMHTPTDTHCLNCRARMTLYAKENYGGLCGACFWGRP